MEPAGRLLLEEGRQDCGTRVLQRRLGAGEEQGVSTTPVHAHAPAGRHASGEGCQHPRVC